MDRQPYTNGPFRLEEIDGVLHYQGSPILAVADLPQPRAAYGTRFARPWHARINLPPRSMDANGVGEYEGRLYWGSGSLATAGLAAAGVPNPYIRLVYRCCICDGWAAGGGMLFCSADCRRGHRADGQENGAGHK